MVFLLLLFRAFVVNFLCISFGFAFSGIVWKMWEGGFMELLRALTVEGDVIELIRMAVREDMGAAFVGSNGGVGDSGGFED